MASETSCSLLISVTLKESLEGVKKEFVVPKTDTHVVQCVGQQSRLSCQEPSQVLLRAGKGGVSADQIDVS